MQKLKRNVNLCYFLSNANVYYMIKDYIGGIKNHLWGN